MLFLFWNNPNPSSACSPTHLWEEFPATRASAASPSSEFHDAHSSKHYMYFFSSQGLFLRGRAHYEFLNLFRSPHTLRRRRAPPRQGIYTPLPCSPHVRNSSHSSKATTSAPSSRKLSLVHQMGLDTSHLWLLTALHLNLSQIQITSCHCRHLCDWESMRAGAMSHSLPLSQHTAQGLT